MFRTGLGTNSWWKSNRDIRLASYHGDKTWSAHPDKTWSAAVTHFAVAVAQLKAVGIGRMQTQMQNSKQRRGSKN